MYRTRRLGGRWSQWVGAECPRRKNGEKSSTGSGKFKPLGAQRCPVASLRGVTHQTVGTIPASVMARSRVITLALCANASAAISRSCISGMLLRAGRR